MLSARLYAREATNHGGIYNACLIRLRNHHHNCGSTYAEPIARPPLK